MSTSQPLVQWPKWRDTLVYRLRMKNVPGDQIGDILLEVQAHIDDTGETPDEAFGNARIYADSRAAEMVAPVNPWSMVATTVGAFAGSGLTMTGAFRLGAGGGTFLLLQPWLALVLGLVLVFGTLLTLPIDLVRYPNTPGAQRRSAIKWIFGATILVAAIVFYVLGRFMA